MDTFNFVVALLMMMLAVQFNQNWLAFAVVAIMILSTRSIMATILLLAGMGILYFLRDSLKEYWAFIFFGLIIVSLLLGKEKGEQPQDMYGADQYASLMGGGGY